jgi:hypothetical protein
VAVTQESVLPQQIDANNAVEKLLCRRDIGQGLSSTACEWPQSY